MDRDWMSNTRLGVRVRVKWLMIALSILVVGAIIILLSGWTISRAQRIDVVRAVRLQGQPWMMTMDRSSAWITFPYEPWMQKIDLRSGRIVATHKTSLETLDASWEAPHLVTTSRFTRSLVIYAPLSSPRTIPLGGKPSGLLMAYRSIFIANETEGTVTRYALNGKKLVAAQAGIWPETMLPFTSKGNQDILVAEYGSHEVAEFNIHHFVRPVRVFRLPSEPADMAIWGTTLAVTDIGSGQLTVIDLMTGRQSTYTIGDFPGPIGIIDGELWVMKVRDSEVAVLSMKGQILASRKIKGMISQFVPDPTDPSVAIGVNVLTHQLVWLRLRG